VVDFVKTDSPTAGIQEAVDALPQAGGTITLPPGEYRLRQAIHLRGNVTLQGAGTGTVLRKPKHAESRLAALQFEADGVRHSLTPGMQVTAEIHLGTRTILEYLLSPVLGAFQEAGRER